MALYKRFNLLYLVFLVSVQASYASLAQRTLPVPKNCPEGFEGPTCQKHNVALRKNATSSSHYDKWTADKAVDGDKRQVVDSNSCFHSYYLSDRTPWWAVDLGDVFPMNNIVIYYRNEGAGSTLRRFINARILVTNTTGEMLCATVTQSDAENAMKSNGVFRFNCPMSASKLILRHGDSCPNECTLEPCEIQVFECTAGFLGQECDQSCIGGWYGKSCAFQCGNCKEGTVCRNTDGLCLQGCRPGWKRDLCKEECSRGTYGQDCSGQCGQCSDGPNCHHVNGSCLSGICLPGYREHKCDETCSHGTYGQGCNSKCGHCTNDSYCHHVIGSCLNGICQPGYTGDRCDQGLTTSVTEQQSPPTPQPFYQGPTFMEGLGTGVAIGFTVCLALSVVSAAVFYFVRRRLRGAGLTDSCISSRNADPAQIPDGSVSYNAGSRSADIGDNGQYEILDAATRKVDTGNDYASIGSKVA